MRPLRHRGPQPRSPSVRGAWCSSPAAPGALGPITARPVVALMILDRHSLRAGRGPLSTLLRGMVAATRADSRPHTKAGSADRRRDLLSLPPEERRSALLRVVRVD